jgi:hypothetical protein
MSANWVAILFLAVGQAGDEIPQRLPPVPPEFGEMATPQPMTPVIDQRVWSPPPPQFEIHPTLPAAPEVLTQTNFDPHYEIPLSAEEIEEPGTRWTFSLVGPGTDFGTTSLDFNHTWLLGYGDGPPLNITPGMGVHWWTDPAGLGLPARVYDLYLDVQWVPWQTDLWSVSVGLTPGLYGDFAQANGNTFQLTGWIVGNRQLGPEWQLLFGVAYVRQLQTTLLPVGGVIWTPNDDVRLELVIPKPKYAARFRETEEGSLWWYVAGQLGGGAWAVADGPNDNALVGYSDLRASVGVESYRVDGRQWCVDVAYVFSRSVYIDNQQALSPDNAISFTASFAY